MSRLISSPPYSSTLFLSLTTMGTCPPTMGPIISDSPTLSDASILSRLLFINSPASSKASLSLGLTILSSA
ncbi:MAG: hypothetical protein RXQ57_05300 [Caldivirga sp.]